MIIRLVRAADLPALATLYQQTVLTHAPQHYTPAQTAMWASFATDAQHFRRFVLRVTTYVAEDGIGRLVGFAGLSNQGHVASLYVRHDCLHQGIGSALLQTLLDRAEQEGIARLYAEASEFSLGLFQKFGFHHYATEVVDRAGVRFTRYLVEKTRLPKR